MKIISVTYFFVIKCIKKGVTKVKNPINPNKVAVIGTPNSEALLIKIGCAINPPKLVDREKTFTALICEDNVP